jgi:hypothetical protein
MEGKAVKMIGILVVGIAVEGEEIVEIEGMAVVRVTEVDATVRDSFLQLPAGCP